MEVCLSNLLQKNLWEGAQLTDGPCASSLGLSLHSCRGHVFPRLLPSATETARVLLQAGLKLLYNGTFFFFFGGGTLTVLADTVLEMLCSLRLFLSNHCFSLPFRKCQTCFLVLRLSLPVPSSFIIHSPLTPPISYKSQPAWYLLLRRLN